MIALLLLLAFAARVDLVNEVFEIPAHDWRYVPRPVNLEPAFVSCTFESLASDARVRVVLLSRPDLDAWRAGRDHAEIGATPFGTAGSLRLAVHEPDAFVALDNGSPHPVRVHLRVSLEEAQVRYLSHGRRLVVIGISFAVFFAIAGVSAAKLLKAAKN